MRSALDRADRQTSTINTSWLLSPLQDKYDELRGEVSKAQDQTTSAASAVDVAPEMLGANGPRHYFVAFTTPAESRGLGGFVGNWALLTADQGHLELTRTGRSADLAPAKGDPPRTLDAPPDYLARYGALHPEREVRDVTLSPDFPSVAQAIESIYPQTGVGEHLDGVISIDPYALAAMLQITGPIRVSGRSDPLTADNAADFLLREQYLAFDQKSERVDVLDEASRKTFDAFIHAKSLKPSQLASVLGPMVSQRRILASSTVPAEEDMITRFGLDGAFPSHDQGDFFSLVTQNAGNNKIDVYLTRTIAYQATYSPSTGSLDVDVSIKLHNDAPSSGLPDYVIANRPSSGPAQGRELALVQLLLAPPAAQGHPRRQGAWPWAPSPSSA